MRTVHAARNTGGVVLHRHIVSIAQLGALFFLFLLQLQPVQERVVEVELGTEFVKMGRAARSPDGVARQASTAPRKRLLNLFFPRLSLAHAVKVTLATEFAQMECAVLSTDGVEQVRSTVLLVLRP